MQPENSLLSKEKLAAGGYVTADKTTATQNF
jgi:hypothetical protein